MATIPTGNFGQAVARSGRPVQINRADPVGQAAERAGEVVMGGVLDSMAQETRQRLEAKAAADRAQQAATIYATKDGLRSAAEEVATGLSDGSIATDKAETEYRSRAAKVMEGLGKDLPEVMRAQMLPELQADSERAAGAVRKAAMQRDRQNVTSGLQQTLEYLQREYRTDPEGATARAEQTITGLGPHSTLTPDQLTKLRQTWRESTQYTAAFELVSAGRADRKALDLAEQRISADFPDLDPQKRATLLDRVAGYRLHLDQKDELNAQRLARLQDKREADAARVFQSASKLAESGVLSPDYAEEVRKQLQGTSQAGAFRELLRQQKEAGPVAAQPVSNVRAALDGLNARISTGGITPELDAQRQRLQKVLDGQERDLREDGGLRAYAKRAPGFELQPLDFSGGIPGLVQQLTKRSEQAAEVSRWSGRPESPLTPEEANGIRERLAGLAPKERAAMLGEISKAIGEQSAIGLGNDLAPKDPGLGAAILVGAAQTSTGRYTSELVLLGQQRARDEGRNGKGEIQDKVRKEVADAVGTLLPGTSRDRLIEAAAYVAMGMEAEGSSRDIKRAVRLAAGGNIVTFNGEKLVVPAQFDEGQFKAAVPDAIRASVRGLKPDQPLSLAGAAPITPERLVEAGGELQLRTVGLGRFHLVAGGALVMAGRKPLVVEVR